MSKKPFPRRSRLWFGLLVVPIYTGLMALLFPGDDAFVDAGHIWLAAHTLGCLFFLTIAASQTEGDPSAKVADAMAFGYTFVALGLSVVEVIWFIKLDPGSDGQASLAIGLLPIFAGGLGLGAAMLGFVVQLLRTPVSEKS